MEGIHVLETQDSDGTQLPQSIIHVEISQGLGHHTIKERVGISSLDQESLAVVIVGHQSAHQKLYGQSK